MRGWVTIEELYFGRMQLKGNRKSWIGVALGQIQTLVQASISTRDLTCLTEQDLVQMGVQLMGSRKRILSAAMELTHAPTALSEEDRGDGPAGGSCAVRTSAETKGTITDFFLSKHAGSRKHCITDFFASAPNSKRPKHSSLAPARGKENQPEGRRMQAPR